MYVHMKAYCIKRATRAKHQEKGQNNSERKKNTETLIMSTSQDVDLSNKKKKYKSDIAFHVTELLAFSRFLLSLRKEINLLLWIQEKKWEKCSVMIL